MPQLESQGGIVARTKAPTRPNILEFEVGGKTTMVIARPVDADGMARLVEFGPAPKWSDSSPMTDQDVATVVRGILTTERKRGSFVEIVGLTPGAAEAFPGDSRISVIPVEPTYFSLPASPSGLVVEMDDRGDGHLFALSEERHPLGSEGMWWIVTRLIEALEEPIVVAGWSSFLTLGGVVGGRAAQATLKMSDRGVRIVWHELHSGVVGDEIAVHELSFEQVAGWLGELKKVRLDLETRRVHRQRLLAARMAERWARVVEGWVN